MIKRKGSEFDTMQKWSSEEARVKWLQDNQINNETALSSSVSEMDQSHQTKDILAE